MKTASTKKTTKTTKVSSKEAKVSVKVASKPAAKPTTAAARVAGERVPVVAVMGHVDHGKTSLLDRIRGTRVQAGEAGGITQNTRAHMVSLAGVLKTPTYQNITFIDTPGHEAFPEMRKRGARVADIVMLVVAADDGVQPQTKQSAEFIKEAGLPVVIACNKMDLPGANPDKVKQELSQIGILVEEYGGEAILVPVSAQTGEGIEQLLEAIELVAQVAELKDREPAQGTAEGFVLETQLHKDLGPLALVIIKAGQIKTQDYLYADGAVHKIRATLDEQQKRTPLAKQGQPTWLIGLESVLAVGQNVLVFDDLKQAQQLLKVTEVAEATAEPTIEEVLEDADILGQLLGVKEDLENQETKLKVVLKADTQGTLEAIIGKLKELSFENAKVEVFSASTGSITEKDIAETKAIKGIVLGFQVKIDAQAEVLAKRERVLVRTYDIIYNLIDEVDAVIKSMLQPEEEIEEVARAKVKQVFTLSDGKVVAGCEVTKGTVIRGYKAFVERAGEEVAEGKIISLKYLKNDVKEAKKGTECGIILEPNIELQTGDEVVCFKTV